MADRQRVRRDITDVPLNLGGCDLMAAIDTLREAFKQAEGLGYTDVTLENDYDELVLRGTRLETEVEAQTRENGAAFIRMVRGIHGKQS